MRSPQAWGRMRGEHWAGSPVASSRVAVDAKRAQAIDALARGLDLRPLDARQDLVEIEARLLGRRLLRRACGRVARAVAAFLREHGKLHRWIVAQEPERNAGRKTEPHDDADEDAEERATRAAEER